MTTFQIRFQEALDNAGMSCADLSRVTGISQGTLSNYKLGKYIPKQNRIQQIATALHVSPSWLYGVDDNAPAPEDGLVALFQSLSADNRKEAMKYLQYLSSQENE